MERRLTGYILGAAAVGLMLAQRVQLPVVALATSGLAGLFMMNSA